MTTKKTAKADNTKKYVAAEDTIFEGRPVRKDVPVNVKGIENERLQSYLDAGLIQPTDDEDDVEAAKKDDKVVSEDAKKIDTTADKRVEK